MQTPCVNMSPGAPSRGSSPGKEHVVQVEVCLFNSLRRYRDDPDGFKVQLAPGARVGDLVRHLSIPESGIYVAFVNGRSVMADLGKQIEEWVELRDGDRVAFSGPVPFSRAYGAPVI
jgi:hypothetical protein